MIIIVDNIRPYIEKLGKDELSERYLIKDYTTTRL